MENLIKEIQRLKAENKKLKATLKKVEQILSGKPKPKNDPEKSEQRDMIQDTETNSL